MSRVLENGQNQITQKYKVLSHKAVDLVKNKNMTCNIIAHTSGKVVWVQKGQKNNKGSTGNASYGNCVKIKHNNGYYTLYAHLKNVSVKLNQEVKTGQVIGYMGNTGNSRGAHLHFEIRNTKDNRINPTPYLDTDLPNSTDKVTYKTYDNVKNKWLPSVKTGTDDYAGNFGNGVSGLKCTKLTYRVHDKVKNKWLPWVTGDSSYAGNLPNNIDGVQIKNATYRVHLKDGKWLDWVSKADNSSSGYAGIYGKTIDAIQIK